MCRGLLGSDGFCQFAGTVRTPIPSAAVLSSSRAAQANKSTSVGRLRGHTTQFRRGEHVKHLVSSQCCCFFALKVKDGILVDEAVASMTLRTTEREALNEKHKVELACRKIRLADVSRVRLCLTGSLLSPGTEEIWQELQSKRPQHSSQFQRGVSVVSQVQPRHATCPGSRCFPEKSQNSARRLVAWSWWVHLRASKSLDGRSGYIGFSVSSGDPSQSSGVCGGHSHHNSVDSIFKTGRVSSWH